MAREKRKPKKAIRAIGIILAVVVVFAAGFTLVSHAVYHRSDMATIVEIYFRISGTKKKFSDPEECADYMALRQNAKDDTLPAK